MTFCCTIDNDLYAALANAGQRHARFDTPANAVDRAEDGSPVLILADGYPETPTAIPTAVFQRAREKNLRLLVEYPSALPGLEVGAPRKTEWERVVVASDAFGERLARGRIVGVHDCRYVPVAASDPLLVAAKVAGFDTAVFGLPESVSPILFEVGDGSLMVATTQLSRFVTGRYAPSAAWKTIWETILSRLEPDSAATLTWDPTVRPAYGPTDSLPADFERAAFRSATDWYFNSRLLVTDARKTEVEDFLARGVEATEPPAVDAPIGDGTHGIQEGYASGIRFDGGQLQRLPLRADCQAETSAVLALDGVLNGNARSRETAANLLDYVYFRSGMCGGARGNPKHPAFGLVAWGDVSRAWELANYSDDDARVMLATMLSAACLASDAWDEPLLRALFANLRTTGPQGFRSDRIDMPDIEANGWKHYQETERVNFSAHHESYLWACNLWAYRRTGYEPFLADAKSAIRLMMGAFPDGWRWNDSIERARMLLPLAWLVRVEDTPEHRAWLGRIADEVIARQQPSGAIDERVSGGHREYEIPASNEEYGTTETPLIQENGDPVSDQLYTSGFALLGLHEAYAATGDPKLAAAEDKLAEYLCRIQVRSDALPYLNGAWFRAFDHSRWDYWASSGDVGWGAWCIETGWSQAWTAATLGLRAKETNLWNLTAGSRNARHWDTVQAEMAQNDGTPWTGTPWKGSRE
jgi:hypothetical protein